MYSALSVVIPPAAEPVSTALAKQHLRIDQDSDDQLIAGHITAARMHAEQFLGRALLTQTLLSTLKWRSGDRGWWSAQVWGDVWFPARTIQEIELARSPVQSVSSVKILDTANPPVTTTLDPGSAKAEYIVDLAMEPARLRLDWSAVGKFETLTLPIQHVQIQFVAGYAAAASIPQPINQAILLLSAFLYERRGDDGGEIPEFVRSLLWPHRVMGFGG